MFSHSFPKPLCDYVFGAMCLHKNGKDCTRYFARFRVKPGSAVVFKEYPARCSLRSWKDSVFQSSQLLFCHSKRDSGEISGGGGLKGKLG